MKTVRLIISCFFVFGIFFSSCEKEKISIQGSKSPGIAPDVSTITIETIGDYHNQKLDQFYFNFKNKINHLGCAALKGSCIYQSVNEVLMSMDKGENAADLFTMGNKEYGRQIEAKSIADFKSQQYSLIMNNLTLSNTFKTFFSDFISQTGDVQSLVQRDDLCKNFRLRAVSTLTGKEIDIAIASINIFNSSYPYWFENLGKWKSLSAQGGPGIFGNDVTPESIPSADEVGGVAGVIGGAFIGPRGILVGGLMGGFCASVGAAVQALSDWLFHF